MSCNVISLPFISLISYVTNLHRGQPSAATPNAAPTTHGPAPAHNAGRKTTGTQVSTTISLNNCQFNHALVLSFLYRSILFCCFWWISSNVTDALKFISINVHKSFCSIFLVVCINVQPNLQRASFSLPRGVYGINL